ncbi:MAG TPA: hypothetical protein DDX91_06065 [Ruminococcaceae bacterium]|nr:hypothetical protein [Oscillospiraceae bacterium]
MEPKNQLPWIIFDLNEQLYAISTNMVTGILQFPPITPIANAPDVFLGVANIRGDVVPILDLKCLLKIKDLRNDVEIALTALNYKLGGIEDYLAEMRRCTEKNERFSVSADYFGDKINLKAFAENSQTYALLTQVKEGQSKLEEYGDRINTKKDLLEEAVKCGKELENLINNAIRYIGDQSKKMVVSLSFDPAFTQTSLGFVVDNVKSVDMLELVDNMSSGKFLFANSYIVNVAHSDKIKGEILVVNDEEVIKTVDLYHDYLKQEEKRKKLEAEKKKAEEKAAEKKENA